MSTSKSKSVYRKSRINAEAQRLGESSAEEKWESLSRLSVFLRASASKKPALHD